MSVKIKYLGHSAFLIENKNFSIIIDPFLTGNEMFVNDKSVEKVNDILITHAHGDHLGDAVDLSKRTGAQISAIFEVANYCTRKGAKAQGLNIGGKVPFEWGTANWLTAAHSSSLPDGSYGGCPASILITIDGIKIFHAGDTGLHSDLKMIGEFYKPDIALLPIGGFFTMGIEEAVEATKWLGCKTVIPMHYNTFPPIKANPEEFKTQIAIETMADCIILKSNEIFEV
ncbi:MAG: metal-dependent hydrolase [bacterium]